MKLGIFPLLVYRDIFYNNNLTEYQGIALKKEEDPHLSKTAYWNTISPELTGRDLTACRH